MIRGSLLPANATPWEAEVDECKQSKEEELKEDNKRCKDIRIEMTKSVKINNERRYKQRCEKVVYNVMHEQLKVNEGQ